jgi:hypothetical protein
MASTSPTRHRLPSSSSTILPSCITDDTQWPDQLRLQQLLLPCFHFEKPIVESLRMIMSFIMREMAYDGTFSWVVSSKGGIPRS